MRVSFLISEVATGLRRNLTMTVAMILTTGISLALMGTGLVIANMISDMRAIYYGQIQVSIYLTNEVTDAQRDAVAAQLDASVEVRSYTYESKAEAYQRFSQQFAEQPALIEGTDPASCPRASACS